MARAASSSLAAGSEAAAPPAASSSPAVRYGGALKRVQVGLNSGVRSRELPHPSRARRRSLQVGTYMMAARGAVLAAVLGLAASSPQLQHAIRGAVSMPVISLGHPDEPGGCCRTQPTNTSCCAEVDSLQKWWGAGGVGVDTAYVYGTQAALGRALEEFRPERVFVTTKIPCAASTSEAAALIAEDLRLLKLRTVDLLVIHNNRDDSHFCNSKANVTATWTALQAAHTAGQARSIVSLGGAGGFARRTRLSLNSLRLRLTACSKFVG